MRRIRTKLPTRRVLVMIGVVTAFFVVAAPSCRDYNGGGPSDATHVLRVSPAVVCRDGMYVVFVRELSTAQIQTWDGGSGRADRVTVFRGTAAEFQSRPLDVIADQPVTFTLDDNPQASWPGFEPRFPEVVSAVTHAFSVATVKLPWQGGVRLATGESIVGQTYTDEILYRGITNLAPPLGRGPLGPTEVVQPTDPYFDLDPQQVPYSRIARVFPGRQAEGYPTYEDPNDVDEDDPAIADDCWMFPLTASVDVRPGTTANVVDPAGTATVPVAVLSRPGFDATLVAPALLRIGTAAPSTPVTSSDVDADGDLDALTSFVPNRSGLRCGDTGLTVRGGLVGGPPFKGSGSIVTAPCA